MLNLCSSFFDEEGDPLTYTATSSNKSVASVAFVNCDLQIAEIGLGETTIQFCASDGNSKTCCSFVLTIVEENEIVLRYDGAVLIKDESIQICSDPATIIIDVESNAAWGFVTYSDWIQPEIVDNATLLITCPENTTNEWRMGLVKIIDDQEHEALFYIYQTEDCVSGLLSLSDSDKFKYYPNPVKDLLTIELRDESFVGAISYSVVDIEGRVVLKGNAISHDIGVIKIDLSEIKIGLYYIKISDQLGEKVDFPVLRN